jgi:hypothetical protein
MSSLRPRHLVAATLVFAALACTCQDPGGGRSGGAPTEEEPEDGRSARGGKAGKGKGKAGDGGDGSEPGDGEVQMPAGVEYLGDDKWRVQRKVVDRYVENPDKLGCSAREKGKGYELVGVQATDDAYALGGRNRDLVLSINGKSLDDSSDLLNLYLTLQDANQLTVVLERAGARRTHHYQITD